jgi:DNA-binding MarR family transcriptional regulator
MATYLFLRAGTGRGPRTYAVEAAERFGWSSPTVAKVINDLIGAGLISKVMLRERNGRTRCIGYQPLSKNQYTKATKNQSRKNQSTYLLSSKEPYSQKGKLAALPSHGLGAATLAAAHEEDTPSVAFFATSANGCAVEIRPLRMWHPRRWPASRRWPTIRSWQPPSNTPRAAAWRTWPAGPQCLSAIGGFADRRRDNPRRRAEKGAGRCPCQLTQRRKAFRIRGVGHDCDRTYAPDG